MIYISHRGNINGKIKEYENHPKYIDNAIDLGYDVEIDVWMVEGVFLLGHDDPQYNITEEWLKQRVDKLWIHCKNIEVMQWFDSMKSFNYFWHENDTITLTSRGFIWAYPGKQPIKNSIAVKPELFDDNLSEVFGVCTDYVQKYKNYE